jgi:hypothetical protein
VDKTDVESILNGLLGLPSDVKRWDVETGADASGADAIWVYVVLDDSAFTGDNTLVIRKMVRQALRDDLRTWPNRVYIRFRSVSEVAVA